MDLQIPKLAEPKELQRFNLNLCHRVSFELFNTVARNIYIKTQTTLQQFKRVVKSEVHEYKL
jgi:hypothetical protein